MRFRLVAVLFLVGLTGVASACASAANRPSESSVPGTGGAAGVGSDLLPVRYDAETGKVFLTIRRLGEPLLYLNSLATGLGTAAVALDRGQPGPDGLVHFERHGARVFLINENTGARAVSGDSALRRTVEESFPSSVLASFPIQSEGSAGVLVDATDFFLSDVFGVVGRIREAELGTVRLDRERSFIDPHATGAFPLNTGIRAVLSYVADAPGQQLRRLAPDGHSITLEQQHTFMRLPETELARRPFDPRAGVAAASYFDFSQDLVSDFRQRNTVRWRLEPSDTAAYLRGEKVAPAEPIVYYLDPGIPEPYRSAFIEGGLWWNDVLEAAGWRDAFRIESLPVGADPMDARYPMILFVHRQQRGPSYGARTQDPRTGEILTSVVRMDSYRSLVDNDVYMGLLPAAGAGGLDMSAEEFAMARRQQHAAHEIGHTLGFAHNFLAASQGRASVMDYPYPLIRLDAKGEVDISDAYRPSGGALDTVSVRYAYTWFPTLEAEAAGLQRIIREAEARGLRFIPDQYARPEGSYPEATRWVEGDDMLAALERTMEVRRVLIDRFDERAALPGEPLAVLNRRFAHVYLHHRYALEAATKYLGGMEFGFALRGEATVPTTLIPGEEQRRALRLILANLQPEALRIPERVVALIPPVPHGYDDDLTLIPTPAGTAFDPLATAHSLAEEIVGGLLNPERAARLVSFHARDAASPSLGEVLGELVGASWGAPAAAAGEGAADQNAALRRVVQRATLDGLLDLAGSAAATSAVRAAAEHQLNLLLTRYLGAPAGSPEEVGHRAVARRDVERYFEGNDEPADRPRPAAIPLPWP